MKDLGKERLLVVNADTYFKDRSSTMRVVYDFLDLPHVTETQEKAVQNMTVKNQARRGHEVTLLPQTRDLLREFLAPWNKKLAKFLEDDSFLWKL